MTKELENLLEDLDSGEEVKTKYGICYAYSPDIVEELKQALLELKAIKEANPSEALKCLKRVKNYEVENYIKEGWNIILYEEMQEELDTIKQSLLKAQELEKVLNGIIKHLSFAFIL